MTLLRADRVGDSLSVLPNLNLAQVRRQRWNLSEFDVQGCLLLQQWYIELLKALMQPPLKVIIELT